MHESPESLEDLVNGTAGDVCACLREHGYEKCKPGDLPSIQLGEWLRDIEEKEMEDQEQEMEDWEQETEDWKQEMIPLGIENPEQQINTHVKCIAIKFCLKNYNSIKYHIHQLNRLGISSKLIKNSELYNLATECVVQNFKQESNNKNYKNALNIIDIARNVDIKIPEEIKEKYTNIKSLHYTSD